MNYIHRNMDALKRNYRGIYDKIKEHEDKFELTIETERYGDSEYKKIHVIDKLDNVEYDLDYTDDYKKKAHKLKYNKFDQIVAFGFSPQLRKLGEFSKLIIIEPHMSKMWALMHDYDFAKLFNKKVVILFTEHLSLFDMVQIHVVSTLNRELVFIEDDIAKQEWPDKYESLRNDFNDAIHYKNINLVTNIKHSRKWRNNTIGNLPYIVKHPDTTKFYGKFNLPAILVAAGPSLDKNIAELKRLNGRALIICAGTSASVLQKNDIKPDIIVSIDGKKLNYTLHFENLPDWEDVYLFSELGNFFRINWNWKGPQVFFTMQRNFYGWVHDITGDFDTLRTGGTVMHSATDLAYKLGCEPIVFMGQDLAYPGGQLHSKDTNYNGEDENTNKRIEIEGINGPVETTQKYMTMIAYFNNYFAQHPDRTFIDATEGGCKFDGPEISNLRDVIGSFEEGIDAKSRLDEIYNANKPDFEALRPELEKKIDKSIRELAQAKKLSENQMEITEKCINAIGTDSFKELHDLMQEYEKIIKGLDTVKYFVDRTLIPETMAWAETRRKYYPSKKRESETKLNAYLKYREGFLEEVDKCLNILLSEYTEEGKEG